jgi:hypothetical protein
VVVVGYAAGEYIQMQMGFRLHALFCEVEEERKPGKGITALSYGPIKTALVDQR